MGKDILSLLRFISLKGMFVQGFVCINGFFCAKVFVCKGFCV